MTNLIMITMLVSMVAIVAIQFVGIWIDVPEPSTTEVIIHAEQGIICEVDEYDEIWCSLTEDK